MVSRVTLETLNYSPPTQIYEARRRFSPNVLIFGETGVGKSSVVNLIAGEDFADVSAGAMGCTMEATSYDIILPDGQGFNHHIRLFDTVGLNGPQFGTHQYLTAIEKANTLICQLQRTGGIRLLVFCIRGGRITAVMQNNYHLFCDILCRNQVPVAFAITGLENEPSMEGWWEKNVGQFEKCGLSCASHACITAIRGPDDCYARRYNESQVTMRAMLLAHVARNSMSIPSQSGRTGWFAYLASSGRHPQCHDLKDLIRQLQYRCRFSRAEATYLAGKIWARWRENENDFVNPDDASSICLL